jgi:hypothetical protein
MGVVDLEQADRADRSGVSAVIDRELDRLGLAVPALLEVLLDPLLL